MSDFWVTRPLTVHRFWYELSALMGRMAMGASLRAVAPPGAGR
jgi:hypothetical protein